MNNRYLWLYVHVHVGYHRLRGSVCTVVTMISKVNGKTENLLSFVRGDVPWVSR